VLLFNSAVTVHPVVRSFILQGDQFLFLMVMIALGLTTSLKPLQGVGGLSLVAAGGFALLLSAGVAYSLVRLGLPGDHADEQDSSLRPTPTGTGARLFDAVGCAKCHVPSLRGVHGDVPLYSDLLLHDMGSALDDKITQGQASGAEWRTTPLIGTRLRDRYLHDGRATTLRDAVLEHGGEAEIVRKRFFELDEDEQQAVFAFVGAL
jgi:hypothetical protein